MASYPSIAQSWQSNLKQRGFYGGRIDGRRGPLTDGAIRDCKDWQTWLNVKGFGAGIVDGDPGPQTTKAIKAFQVKTRIMPDGVIGPVSRNAREHYSGVIQRVVNTVIDRVLNPIIGKVYKPWPDLVLHYSASPTGNAEVIDRWHRARGRLKGGYHAVVTREGIIQTGDIYPQWLRTSAEIGAHILGRNYRSYGICFISIDGELTAAQFAAGRRLIASLHAQRVGYERTDGHRFFPNQATSCPGTLDISGLQAA